MCFSVSDNDNKEVICFFKYLKFKMNKIRVKTIRTGLLDHGLRNL